VTEVCFVPNQSRTRLVGGLTAVISLFFGAVLVLLLPLSQESRLNIFFVLSVLACFTAIFYLIPSFYQNSRLNIIPGLSYVAGITATVYFAGSYGYLFMLFFFLFLAIAAFVYSNLEYIFLVLLVTAGTLAITFYPDLIVEAEYAVGLYMIIALSVLLRIYANNAFMLEAAKDKYVRQVENLEQDKGEMRHLLESLSDGLIVVDENNKVTFINPAALNILGLVVSLGKILGRDMNDYLPTIGPNGPEPITKEVFESLEPSIRNDFRIVTSRKTIRIHTNASPVISDDHQLKGAIVLFRDITNDSKSEEQRAEFNAIASHELRTPLSVIEGYLYYVLDPASKLKYDKDTAEYIKRAHDAATDLNSLVTDILTVVKADEDTLEVCLKKIDAVSYLEKITHSFEGRAKAKKIKMSFKVVAHEKVPEILTDPVKIREIFENLLINAIKFTEKGKIEVEVGLLKNELLVSVMDTGIGISKPDQAGIFNKFYRAENWRTRKTNGTGLGLYIAKTLTERLGGRIGVSSVVGKGSKFYFTVPLTYKNKELKEIK
jgi:PAS domain S-box-containing protein